MRDRGEIRPYNRTPYRRDGPIAVEELEGVKLLGRDGIGIQPVEGHLGNTRRKDLG